MAVPDSNIIFDVFPKEDRQYYPIENGKRLEAVELLEGGCLTCPPTWKVPKQRYSYHRLYYIYGGDVVCTFDDRKVKLLPGHLYVFPSKFIPYGISHRVEAPLKVLWCHFGLIPDFKNNLIDIDVARESALSRAIDTWRMVSDFSRPGNEIYHLLCTILYLIDREVELQFTDNRLDDVERYMVRRIDTDISVESVARHFGYTRSHFTRKFMEIYGLTPGDYLRMLRMSKASNMLLSGCDLERVRVATGYSDKKVFSRAFKQYFGVSPTEFNRYFQPRADRAAGD